MSRRQLGTGQKAFFGITLALVLLLLAEGALRVSGVAPAYQADAIGGWRSLPEQDNALITGIKEQHRFRLSTNADGLRTRVPRARRPGVQRVALMGDSIVFGWGVDDGQTVADGLRAGLAAAGPPEVEVLNAAQPGYSTTQVERLFSAVVAEYQPDLTIVFLPMHDHNLVLVSDREHLSGARGLAASVRVAMAKHLRVYEFLRRSFTRDADQAFVVRRGADQDPGARVSRVSDDERRDNILSIAARARAWGGRVAIGHMPFYEDLTSSAPGPRMGADWAASLAAAEDLPIIDLRACCGPEGADLVFPYDPGHLTKEGNLRAGRFGAGQVRAALP